MRRIALALLAAALACAGSSHLVLDLEHRAPMRKEELPEGISRVVWAVTISDERGDDPHFLCDAGGQVLSQRPVSQVVRDAVESELRVRDLRVAAPEEADVILHIELQDFLCWAAVQGRAQGIHGKIQAELSLKINPGGREVYWTTLTQEAFRVPSAGRDEKRETLLHKSLDQLLGDFAQHVATHPDLMIEIQELQARRELPD